MLHYPNTQTVSPPYGVESGRSQVREQAIAVELTERGPSNLVLLTLDLTQEDEVWVGTCIELGTSAYADSLEELRGEIADAIGLQLNEAMRLGFIDEYIQERSVRTRPLVQMEVGY